MIHSLISSWENRKINQYDQSSFLVKKKWLKDISETYMIFTDLSVCGPSQNVPKKSQGLVNYTLVIYHLPEYPIIIYSLIV